MYAYLLKIDGDVNNNKYYEMKGNDDFTFTAYYGRVGYSPQTMTYTMSKWDRTVASKVKKGYVDVTHLRAKAASGSEKSTDNLGNVSHIIRDMFQSLLYSTKETVSRNYLLPVQGVTKSMVDDAQGTLDSLVYLYNTEEWSGFNNTLIRLYTIIPRKMDRVANYLLRLDLDSIIKESASKIISSEQDTLDSLKGQILVVDNEEDSEDGAVSLFTTLGISVEDITPSDVSLIKNHLGDISDRYHQAVRVNNSRTTERFNKWLSSQTDQTRMTLWHGSRTQNWISLLQKGLVLNPTGVVITGKMFGYGLYFAPRAKKSLGYTSVQNSYWAGGNDNRGYMGLYDVHTGNMKRYTTSQSGLTYDSVSRMGYNSVMGERGSSLQNDEIIVYHEAQTNIKYLVELR